MTGPDPRVIRASEVEDEVVTWLWAGRIPYGKLSAIVGDPALGKSTISLDMAARITVGAGMPDGAPGGVPRNVLVMSAEDGLADTIVPRLRAAGANDERVFFLDDTDEAGDPLPHPTLPDAVPTIEAAVQTQDVALLVIDPLSAFLGSNTNSWNDASVRGALAPLAAMAERTGAAVLIVAHLNKAVAKPALYRVGGSIGIVAACRSVLLVGRHPDYEDRRILAPLKANLSRQSSSQEFTLTGTQDGPVTVTWNGTCDYTAEQLLSQQIEKNVPTAVDHAERFLSDVLAEGARPANEVADLAKSENISERTLRRARKQLAVLPAKTGFDGGWEWSLPEGGREETMGAHSTSLAAFGDGDSEKDGASWPPSKAATTANLEQTLQAPQGDDSTDGILGDFQEPEPNTSTLQPEGGQPADTVPLGREVYEV
jgi:RecA-family ATPase